MKKICIGFMFGLILLGGCNTHSSAQTEEKNVFPAPYKSAAKSMASFSDASG